MTQYINVFTYLLISATSTPCYFINILTLFSVVFTVCSRWPMATYRRATVQMMMLVVMVTGQSTPTSSSRQSPQPTSFSSTALTLHSMLFTLSFTVTSHHSTQGVSVGRGLRLEPFPPNFWWWYFCRFANFFLQEHWHSFTKSFSFSGEVPQTPYRALLVGPTGGFPSQTP